MFIVTCCMILATGFVMGTTDFRPPANLTTLNQSSENLSQVITLVTPTQYQIWCKSAHREGGFWANARNITKHFYLFIPSFLEGGLTYKSDLLADCHTEWLIQCWLMQWCKDVPFWGFVDTAAHLAVKFPPNPYFWGLNRRFQAKYAKYWNFHIIKFTASITTKFCTVIKTTKYQLWVIQIHCKQIQDGRQPPTWKIEKL